MAVVFQDGFDHYGDDVTEGVGVALARMLTFGWASLDGVAVGDPLLAGAVLPARTGRGALRIAPQSGNTLTGARIPLPAAYTELFVHWGVYMEDLPDDSTSCRLLDLRDAANAFVGELVLGANGSVKYISEGAATLITTAALTITAGAWHSMQLRVKKSATVGVVQLYVDDVLVIDLAAQNTGATAVGNLRWRQNGAISADSYMWIDDLVVNNTTGPRNTGFLGQVRVATIYPKSDDQTAWTSNTRHKFGAGIVKLSPSTNDALTCADNVQLELGAGDYTMESFVRFLTKPAGATQANIFGKWREATNERSFRLFLGGPAVNNSHLELQSSTDGLLGTVVTVASAEFDPVAAHWYHICVQRSADQTVMFVDGVPLNAPATDAATYQDNTSLFCVGGQQEGSLSIGANTSVDGFMEEVRVTKGVARYNMTGFTPPVAAFPRSSPGDPDFASVSLLMGFDNSIMDESSFGRAVSNPGLATRYEVQDTPPGAYKTVNNQNPLADTGVEAPFVAATNVLTFSGQPANNNTVTVDGVTYTFKTVFVDTAGFVLIGATVSDSIDNLVAAINGDAGAGTLYGTGTTPSTNASALNIDNDQMQVTANTPGTAGNAVGTTETGANTAWSSGVTLAGGLDIPTPSSFFLTRLPPQTTGVKAITLIARAKKTDSGDGTIQTSFVTADDSTANGIEHPLTTSDAYYGDIIEDDPSTITALSPASFIGARIRIDRTE